MQDNFERLQGVARAETREALIAFLEREKVESYTDDDGSNMCGGRLRKSFRKGGPLEYMNPPDRDECFIETSLENWIAATVRDWERRVLPLPPV